MSKYFCFGNWKMNNGINDANEFLTHNDNHKDFKQTNLCIFPQALHLLKIKNAKTKINTGCQNSHFEDSGAFTGEISPDSLAEANIKYCLVGHSERRHIFKETNEDCNKKIKALLERNITPVFCFGEQLEDFENQRTNEVLRSQLELGLKDISKQDYKKIIFAYEPVWAIGTGKTATTEIIARSIKTIEEILSSREQKILYGGSVKPMNITEIISVEGVSGALIGGASLKADNFFEIANKIDAV